MALGIFLALVAIVLIVLQAVFQARRRFDAPPTATIDVAPTRPPAGDTTPVDKVRRPQRPITVVHLTLPAAGAAEPTDAEPAARRPTSPVTPDVHEATFLRALEAAEYYEEPREPIVRAYTDHIVARVRREVDAGSDLRRCQAIDSGGERCPRPSAGMLRYVGQPGFPAADVALCVGHALAAVSHPGADR